MPLKEITASRQGTRFAPHSRQSSHVTSFAIGDPTDPNLHSGADHDENMVYLSFLDLTEDVLSQHGPSVVYSPAVASDFDCVELALLLHNIGYTGAYRAVAPHIPRPELIEREIAQICPRLDFKLLKVH